MGAAMFCEWELQRKRFHLAGFIIGVLVAALPLLIYGRGDQFEGAFLFSVILVPPIVAVVWLIVWGIGLAIYLPNKIELKFLDIFD